MMLQHPFKRYPKDIIIAIPAAGLDYTILFQFFAVDKSNILIARPLELQLAVLVDVFCLAQIKDTPRRLLDDAKPEQVKTVVRVMVIVIVIVAIELFDRP
jgi:hypothetical protein